MSRQRSGYSFPVTRAALLHYNAAARRSPGYTAPRGLGQGIFPATWHDASGREAG